MSATAPLQTQAAKSQALSNSRHAGLLLQRKCGCGSPTASLTGECAECKSKKRLQTKLTIGASNDPLELEADRVADQVMAASANPLVCGAAPRIQQFTGHSTGGHGTAPAGIDRVLATSGRPLDPALQQDMGQRFGHDFSRVRVHSGAAAEQSAREVNAEAYTMGHDIVFGAGRFAPGTHAGRRLIAHELTHVVQQTIGGVSKIQSSDSYGDEFGQEAKNISDHVLDTVPENVSPRSIYSAVSVASLDIMRAIDPCLDKCEKEFNECLDRSKFPPECIGARSDCQRRCQPSSPSPEGKHACVVKEQIPIITTPVAVFDDVVLMQTDVDIEWKADDKCDCACGEYRQYVKGHILKNDTRYDIGLCDGAKLEENTWHEDGDAQTGLCFGHRDRPSSKNDVFDRSNRESGCHYHGKDEPRVPGRRGDRIDVDLKFKGQTYDKCLNTFGQIHEWAFTYKGPLAGM